MTQGPCCRRVSPVPTKKNLTKNDLYDWFKEAILIQDKFQEGLKQMDANEFQIAKNIFDELENRVFIFTIKFMRTKSISYESVKNAFIDRARFQTRNNDGLQTLMRRWNVGLFNWDAGGGYTNSPTKWAEWNKDKMIYSILYLKTFALPATQAVLAKMSGNYIDAVARLASLVGAEIPHGALESKKAWKYDSGTTPTPT
jgi:hypothetical protein